MPINNQVRKGLVLGILVLFIGLSVVPRASCDIGNMNITSFDDPLFYDDFEDGTLDNWNIINGNWEVISDGGNHIAHLNRSSEIARRMVSIDAIQDNVIIDAEINGDSTYDICADKMVGFYSNANCSSYFYFGVENGIQIGYWDGDTWNELIYDPSVMTYNNVWCNAKIKLENGNIFAKAWEKGTNEPFDWQISYFGATIFGYHLVLGTWSGTHDEEFWFDNISVKIVPDIVYVDDDYNISTPGFGYDRFNRIQYGVNEVSESGTVFVYSGIYDENILIEKSLDLIGENTDTTIIDGGGDAHVVRIFNCVDVVVEGFTIHNAGINGVSVWGSSNGTISNCTIYDSLEGGIYLGESSNNFITRCVCYNNHYNILLEGSSANIIQDTQSYNASGVGIGFGPASDNTIINCSMNNNPIGLELSGSDNIIYNCEIYNNSEYGARIAFYSLENLIFHTNFIDNYLFNTFDEGTNPWYNATLGEGNYYDDYNGTDDDGDGIGDTPYDIPGGDSQDLYPLMDPWGDMPPVANFTYIIDDFNVSFDATSSFDRDGTIISWLWDFGDGIEGAGPIINHTYPGPGIYNVTLTVIDDDDYEDNNTKQIMIRGFEFTTALVFGRHSNLSVAAYVITFNAEHIRVITFSPFSWNPYTSGELIIMSKNYLGFIGIRWILAIGNVSI